MATLLTADLPSDEEDDLDYQAAKDRSAAANDRKEFQLAGTSGPVKKRRRRSTAYVEEEEEEAPQGAPQQAPDEEEEDELAAEDENDPRVRAKRAKIGQLWDLLNSRPGGGAPASQPKPTPSAAPTAPPPTKKDPATSSSSLASLCKPSKAPPKARGSDELWMRSLGLLPKTPAAPKPSTTPAPAATSTPQPTAATTSNAAAPAAPQQQPEQPQGNGSHANGADAAEPGPSHKSHPPVNEEARAAAAAALAAVRSGTRGHHDKVDVTETRRFAGKDIQVTLQKDKNSKEAQKAAERAAKPPPTSGLDAFLAEVEKKKKVNVLDKSKADWQQMKSKDAVLEEELEAHRRSGGQYLDKQDFLKRAELREYEKERDTRLASDVRNRGRL